MPTYHQKRHRKTRCPKCLQFRKRRHKCQPEFAGREATNRAIDQDMNELLAEAGITLPKEEA